MNVQWGSPDWRVSMIDLRLKDTCDSFSKTSGHAAAERNDRVVLAERVAFKQHEMLVFGEICKVHPETTYGYKDTWQRPYALDRPEERGKERGGRRQDHLQSDIGIVYF